MHWSALETNRLSADNVYVVRFKLPAGNWHSDGVCGHDNHNVASKKNYVGDTVLVVVVL
jgi:hypothetical protein